MLHLIPASCEYFLANLIVINVMHHALGIEVSKLNGEGFESVAFGHVVFHGGLEFFVREGLPADSFEFVVREGRGEEVGELGVERG